MFKRTLGFLIASTLLAFGCGDSPSPTEPRLQATPHPTPPPAAAEVPRVVSAETTTKYYRQGWIIRGLNFVPDPKVYFESAQSVIVMSVEENTFRGDLVGIVTPPGAAPGEYTPCVETIHGKGCGNFLLTVMPVR